MGSLITMLLGAIAFFGAVLFAIIVRQGADEFKALTPRLVDMLLRKAVLRLPESKRERHREEWASHIDDMPGEAGKWIEACSFLLSARRMAKMEPPAHGRVIRVGTACVLLTGDMDFIVGQNVLGMSASAYSDSIIRLPHHGSALDLSQRRCSPVKFWTVYFIARMIAFVSR